MKKALFFDVDGTLVDPKTGQIPSSAVNSLNRLQQEGYKICIATGRNYENLVYTKAYLAFTWDGYVCCNGQQVLDAKGNFILNEGFSEELVHRVMDTATRLGHVAQMVSERGWELLHPANENVKTVMDFLHEPVPSLVTYEEGMHVSYMIAFADLGYDYADYAAIKGIRTAVGYTPYADLVLDDCTKATGCRKYCEVFGIDTYLAFGDSMNDYHMILDADVSVAMGNAVQELKDCAKIVTKAVDEDGIAYALDVLKVQEMC